MAEQLTLLAAGAAEPPDRSSRERIRTDTATTLFVDAGAGAGKTSALVGRILTLVDEGIDIGAIAAITFTEKAAAELRHRLRSELGARSTPLRHVALDALDHAPIGTLHAFARRLLFELPVEAGLPPGFTVLDDLESQLALDERWEDLLDEVLDDADHEVVPGLTAAELVQLVQWGSFGGSRGLRRVIEDFQANWDLVEHRVSADPPARPGPPRRRHWRGSPPSSPHRCLPPTSRPRCSASWPRSPTQVAVSDDIGPALAALEAIRDRLAKPGRTGNKDNWRHHGGREALDALRAEEVAVAGVVEAHLGEWRRYRQAIVGVVCGRFVLDAATARAAAGTLEFHDLLVLARRLLATDATARRHLHDRYQRVLLDEFQDTDPIQLEIAVRLTAPPDGQPRHDITGLRPIAGRLFVVGDPKQSIYRFRRADIATYLAAPAQLDATTATLSANFRSTDAVIDWVNGVFGAVIQPEPLVQPPYGPLDACRPEPRQHGTVRVLGPDEHDGDDVDADELRQREAASVAGAIATALREGWPVGDGAGDVPAVPPRRHRRAAARPHLAAGVGGRARRARRSRTGPRTPPSCTSPPRSATCCWRCAPRPTRPMPSPSSPRCARRCTAAATPSCWRGGAPAAAST